MIVIIVIIILSVFLSGNYNSNNKIDTAATTTIATTAVLSSTDAPTRTSIDKIKRREKLFEIIAPLSFDLFDPFNKQDYEITADRTEAFNWLVDDDIIATATATATTTKSFDLALQENEWKIRQRYILALLYFSTNGQSWDKQYNFLSSNLDECDWTFVATENDGVFWGNTAVEGAICNEQGRVEQLRMWWTSMSGTYVQDWFFYVYCYFTSLFLLVACCLSLFFWGLTWCQ
jgi:hypothetical protein